MTKTPVRIRATIRLTCDSVHTRRTLLQTQGMQTGPRGGVYSCSNRIEAMSLLSTRSCSSILATISLVGHVLLLRAPGLSEQSKQLLSLGVRARSVCNCSIAL